MNRKLNFICLVLLITGNLTGQISVSLNPEIRSISANLIGLNGRSTEGPSWDDPDFLSLIEEMHPGMVRYPAGTQANYWDWRTGTFIEGCGKTAKNNFSITSFVGGLPDNTEIIYVVNMARPTPVTGVSLNASEAVLKSDETLQLKIEDMLAALEEFERQGRFPEAIELGNEFYFNNDHAGIYAANPTFYMSHVRKICEAVKAAYPNLRILLCTTKGGTSNRDNWNNTVFNTLQSDHEFAGFVHGVVQHHYINATYGDPTQVIDVESAKTAIAEGFLYTREHSSDYEFVPDNLALWLTEYGATKENAEGSWATGLRAVAMTMGWMELGDKIERLFYHHITDDPSVVNKTQMKLGPIGVAFGLLGQAASEKNRLQEIQFSNNPLVSGTVKALHAFKFRNQREEAIFILNTSENRFELDGVENLFLYEGVRQVTSHWSSTPFETPVYDDQGIVKESSVLDANLSLPPFSVTLIRVDNSTSIEQPDLSEKVKIYPSVFTDNFNVILPQELNEASIVLTDLNGTIFYQSKVYSGSSMHSPAVDVGLYVLSVRTNEGIMIKKMLKR